MNSEPVNDSGPGAVLREQHLHISVQTAHGETLQQAEFPIPGERVRIGSGGDSDLLVEGLEPSWGVLHTQRCPCRLACCSAGGRPGGRMFEITDCSFVEAGGVYLVFEFQTRETPMLEFRPGEMLQAVLRRYSPKLAAIKGVDQYEQLGPAAQIQLIKILLNTALLDSLNLRKISIDEMGTEKLNELVQRKIEALLRDFRPVVNGRIGQDELRKELLHDVLGYGPITDFLQDPGIDEVMVNRYNQIFIERNGRLVLTPNSFLSDEHVIFVIQRMVHKVGRTLNESRPIVDARLADGSRVNAIIPPLSLSGPTLTIRKFSRRFRLDDLVARGALPKAIGRFLSLAVGSRQNMIIAGGTGSGKTTLLNVVSSFIPCNERIVTIEDSAELKLDQPHVITLETRNANIEGRGQVAIRDLVRNALRMRPDRIIVGECRGGEALDMLQAMNTGHDGSLTTIHANSPYDTISRLETIAMMSDVELPAATIRRQICSAINLIVQTERFADGSRKLVSIAEIAGMEGDAPVLKEIFFFKPQGYDADQRIRGTFQATGYDPCFIRQLREIGLETDASLFRQGELNEE